MFIVEIRWKVKQGKVVDTKKEQENKEVTLMMKGCTMTPRKIRKQ